MVPNVRRAEHDGQTVSSSFDVGLLMKVGANDQVAQMLRNSTMPAESPRRSSIGGPKGFILHRNIDGTASVRRGGLSSFESALVSRLDRGLSRYGF